MNRCPKLTVGCVLALGAFAIGFWMLWPAPSAITRENAEKIHAGMTLAEVEAILGGPERDEATGPTTFHALGMRGFSMHDWRRDWIADRVVIRVHFGPDDSVSIVAVLDNARTPRSMLDIIRGWIRLSGRVTPPSALR